jgi:hypothetical protein
MRFPQSSATLCLLVFSLFSCEKGYEAKKNLATDEYSITLAKLAPYVIAKSDEFNYEARFEEANKPFYDNFINLSSGELQYLKEKDTATFFFFKYRDLTSLYEHYRGLGGYFKMGEKGTITFMNLLYHTPRLTKEEMDQRGKLLFEELLKNGNVNTYSGNKQFIHTPNADFYYNTKLNKWDYTENSSWKFLEEAKQQAQSDSVR